MTLLSLLLIPPALALPDRVAAELPVAGAVEQLVAHPEGRVAGLIAGSAFHILDGWTWEVTETSGTCSQPADVAVVSDDGGETLTFWVACGDGTVVPVSVDAMRQVSLGEALTISDYPNLGLTTDGEILWVVSEADTNIQLHRVDLATLAVDADDSFPSSLSLSGFEDVALTGGLVIVTHGSDDTSRVDLNTGSASRSSEGLGGRDLTQIAVGGNNVFIADANGGLVRYYTAGNRDDYAILLDDADGLTGVGALALDEGGDEPMMILYETGAGELLFFEYLGSTVSDQLSLALPAGDIQALSVMGDYLLGGTSGSTLEVATEAPWVTITSAPAETLSAGDSFELGFSADEDGDYSLRLGAPDGEELASGSLLAGEVISAALEVGETFIEGANRLYVLLDGRGTVDGGAAVDVDVDNPPSRVALAEGDVGFGDGKIHLQVPAISDADLADYRIYLSTVGWDPADYSAGGPAYEGPDEGLESPLSISPDEAVSPGVDAFYTIEPVTNGVTYYVAVRAVDSGGLEGPMSEVVSVVPQQTLGAAELAGEAGGCQGLSSRGPAPASLALGALAGLMALSRRRGGLATAALLGAGLLGPQARAEDRPKKHSSYELRIGPTDMLDPDGSLTAVYGDRSYTSFWFEGGPQLWRVLEFDGGVGLMRRSGNPVGELDGGTSTESSRINLLPLSISATARLELLREQWVVPFAKVGADYWAWMEQKDVGDGYLLGERFSGGKPGVHWGYGVDLLLDPLGRSRASQAEARWGIRDTYLVIEYAEYRMSDGNQGLDFANTALNFGLKIDR